MKTLNRIIITSCFLTAIFIKADAQNQVEDTNLMNQLNKDDQTAIDAVALYPEETRNSIYKACTQPEVIVRLNAMQKKTNADFSNLLSTYPKDVQEKIWNLTRYPGLISKLVENGQKSAPEINKILDSYPHEIDETAMEAGTKYYSLLSQIDQSNRSYNSQFENIIREYPAPTQEAFRSLIKQPEVLTILSDNMHMTVVIGDLYKRNPQLVEHNSDSLNHVLSQKQKQETKEWNETLEKNPEAKQQYEQAAKEYAQENNIQYQTYENSYPYNPMSYYPYNWWFGYPTWYPYSYWRPYPYWYDLGYYYGPGYRMVFIGMPSPYFFNWYWYHNEHHYRYPYFSNHCYNYYYSHPGSVWYNPVCRTVNNWRIENHNIVTNDWNRNDAHRVELFKEYGQMETNRETFNKQNPQHTVDRTQFINSNQDKYPMMKAATVSPQYQNINAAHNEQQMQSPVNNNITRPSMNEEKPSNRNDNVQPKYNNPVNPQPAQQPVHYNTERQNENRPAQQQPQYNKPQQNQQVTPEPRYNNPASNQPIQHPTYNDHQQYNNATEYHRSTWQQVQTRPQQSYQPVPAPRPMFQPAPAARPSFQSPAPSRSAPAPAPRGGGGRR